MEAKLRAHIEGLFSFAPNTQQAQDMKEEIIMNTIQRYHDLIDEGATTDAAYKAAIDGIGDVKELMGAVNYDSPRFDSAKLEQCSNRKRMFIGLGVIFIILSVASPVFFSYLSLDNIGAAGMLSMIAVGVGLIVFGNSSASLPLETNPQCARSITISSAMLACAVALYIFSVVPVILCSDTFFAALSPIAMLLIIAGATVMLVMRKKPQTTVSLTPEVKREVMQSKPVLKHKGAYRGITAAIWVSASVLYLVITVISLSPMVWLIFPLAAAVQRLVRSVFEYKEAEE